MGTVDVIQTVAPVILAGILWILWEALHEIYRFEEKRKR